VFGVVGIDMIAGPSEILVLCDGSTDPDWIAMDLFSQAEHDEMAQAILLTPHAEFADRVAASIARLLPGHAAGRGDREVARRPAARWCVCATWTRPARSPTRSPPSTSRSRPSSPSAGPTGSGTRGAMFLGAWSSESLGDYCAGPNHVLPTMRTRALLLASGVYDFQKRTSLIRMSERGARALGPIASILARGEGLQAHARSAECGWNRAGGRARAQRRRSRTEPRRLSGDDRDGARERASQRCATGRAPDVRSMSALPRARRDGYVKLDAMENPYRLPEALREDLRRRAGPRCRSTAIRCRRYAAAQGRDRRHAARARGLLVVLGNGSDELISILTTAVAQPGARIVAPSPSFVMYELSARWPAPRSSACR
jgi:hypothetical protein